MIKWIAPLVVILASISTPLRGQEAVELDTTPQCSYYSTIQGPTASQLATPKSYNIIIEGSGSNLLPEYQRLAGSYFAISYEGSELARFDNVSDLTYNFDKLGSYTISHYARINECDITTTLDLTTYEHSIIYIGTSRSDVDENTIDQLKQRSILLHTIITPQTDITNTLQTKKEDIIHAQNIIINTPTSTLQPIMRELQTILPSDASTIAIVTDVDPDLSRKVIGSLTYDSTLTIYTMASDALRELVLLWRIGERGDSQELISSTTLIESVDRSLSLSRVIDALVFAGVPLTLLASIITLIAITCLLVFGRQIIGIEVFSVYYPLLGAVSMLLLGEMVRAVWLGISWLAYRVMRIILKYITILSHAKIGLYIALYGILSLVSMWILAQFPSFIDRDSLQLISTRGVMSGFIIIIFLSQKVFSYPNKPLKHITRIIRYALLTRAVSRALGSLTIQYRMLTNTRILLICIILIVLIGRFTGMKLLEIRRFWELITQSKK